MSEKYKIWDNRKAYFLTLTVVGWIDVFTRRNHKLLIADSLQYCQKEKGLTIFAYCLMPSHLHMIAMTESDHSLSDIIRDFKKYTSKAIVQEIISESESRREWMLDYFMKKNDEGKIHIRFWQEGNHPEEINSNEFFNENLEYIHTNPVKELIVERPEDYLFSSARNYAGLSSPVEIVKEMIRVKTIK